LVATENSEELIREGILQLLVTHVRYLTLAQVEEQIVLGQPIWAGRCVSNKLRNDHGRLSRDGNEVENTRHQFRNSGHRFGNRGTGSETMGTVWDL